MLLFILAALTGQSGDSARVFDCRNRLEIPFEILAEELAKKDVVFLGEEHDNPTGHAFYAQLAQSLQVLGGDLVISMEMFERDVQGVVDGYLRGRIGETEFLQHSRPWKTYKEFYRPQIELAKKYSLDVIAGNLPRPVANKISTDADTVSSFLPRKISTPKDGYWNHFIDAMQGHPGMEGKVIEGMYRSQCAKDEAMAESISDYLNRNPHRFPLVLHRCGKFHCEYGLGTVSRFVERQPLRRVSVLTMVSLPDMTKLKLDKEWKKAHYLVVVPAVKKKEEPSPAKSAATEKTTTTPPAEKKTIK